LFPGDKSGTIPWGKTGSRSASIENPGTWKSDKGWKGPGESPMKKGLYLTDRGTWLAKEKDKLDMVIVLEGDPTLFNNTGYGRESEKHKHVSLRRPWNSSII
jgi:ABC-type tungstate transport system permease subunit